VQGNVIDLQFAKALMEEGPYRLNEEKIRNVSTELYYIVTQDDPKSNYSKVRFLDSKKIPSMTDGVRASMTIRGMTGTEVAIDGEYYLDGAFNPLPIFDLLEEFPDVTDILILPQMPFQPMDEIKPSTAEIGMASLAGAASLDLFEKMLLSRKDLRRVLEEITEISHVNIGIMWPAVLESARDTIAQFGGKQPEHILTDLESSLGGTEQRAA
jgi:predicted patatin/cPLA2 family phospholipase